MFLFFISRFKTTYKKMGIFLTVNSLLVRGDFTSKRLIVLLFPKWFFFSGTPEKRSFSFYIQIKPPNSMA
jgi:hypothetical protein